MYVICAAAVFLTCSQQHVVDVLAIASLDSSSSSTADWVCQDQTHWASFTKWTYDRKLGVRSFRCKTWNLSIWTWAVAMIKCHVRSQLVYASFWVNWNCAAQRIMTAFCSFRLFSWPTSEGFFSCFICANSSINNRHADSHTIASPTCCASVNRTK